MSSFLSFIFVIRICDFAAKEACSVVGKWKWNCVAYAQFPDRPAGLQHAGRQPGQRNNRASARETQTLTFVKTPFLSTSKCSWLFCVIQMPRVTLA